MDLGLIRTFIREWVTRKPQERQAPPTSCLSEDEIISALRGRGDTNGRYAAGYLFHTARISETIIGAKRCIDIGAAPGCQLLQLAALHPETAFIGIDRSAALIADGESRTEAARLSNVSWLNEDICGLESLASNSVDAVISTMTLHNLPNLESVQQCLTACARVLSDGGAVYIEDYGRLKAPASINYFNLVNEVVANDPFAKLNAASMHAAFLIDDLKPLFETHFPLAHLYSTALIPFLNVLKTPDRPLHADIRANLHTMREELPIERRQDLDDLRKFFKFGGWNNDPFSTH